MNKKIVISLIGLTSALCMAGAVGLVSNFSKSNNVTAIKAEVPSNTRRVWILNNDNWWTDNNYWVYAWNAEGNYGSIETTKVHMVLTDAYYGIGYADIELANATSEFKLRVVNSWGDYGQTVTLDMPAFGGEDIVWMNSGGTWDAGESRNDRNASLGTTGLSAIQLHWLLVNAGVDTCSTANTNGYNAYPQMYTDFFGPSAGVAGIDTEIVSGSYTVQDYIDGMAARYGA